ncbi:MAG: nitrite reductase [Actinomycetota bacterium]|nr:MAG: nitrite reductase [Actinomycetota bacterium]
MTLTRRDDGSVAVAGREFPTNRGGLCHKGWTAAQLLQSADRLTTPLVRAHKGAPLLPASWDQALDMVAASFRQLAAEHGPDAVAVFGGGGLTNEKAYALGKFARVVLRTSRIDYNGRFCMSSAAAAANRAFGVDRGMPFPLQDVGEADVVMLVGANVAETMPPFVRHLSAQRERGGRLIVVDPRVTPTARLADLHLQPVPGGDLALLLGVLHVVVARGWVDEDYVRDRTTGFGAVRHRVSAYWPERVEALTGVPADQIREAARLLAGANRAILLSGRGAEQHSKGVDTVAALIDLALALGLPGRPGSGYGAITGQGNGQGGREHGQKADQLPGYRRLADPADRAFVAEVWGVAPDDLPAPGLPASQLLEALGRPAGPQALLVMGSNPVVSAPRSIAVTERLDALALLVVCDPFVSETAARADVVLPVAQWAEEDGTMTNLEGRVVLRRKLSAPPPGVRTDLDVIAELAHRLGHQQGFPAEPQTVFAELRLATRGAPADYSGIDYDRLGAEDGVFWPCPQDTVGTPRPFVDAFPTADGRARFADVTDRAAAELPDAGYPLHLTTGRVLAQYQSGNQTRRITELVAVAPEAFVEMHPVVADDLGVVDGELVQVVSRRGHAVARAMLSEGIRMDTVFMPFHWPDAGNANRLTNTATDPVSGMPEFKVCAVRLERIAP